MGRINRQKVKERLRAKKINKNKDVELEQNSISVFKEEVKALGGTEEDIELLKDVSDSAEDIVCEVEGEDISTEEIQGYLASIGMSGNMATPCVTVAKDEEEVAPHETTSSNTKQKKTRKNVIKIDQPVDLGKTSQQGQSQSSDIKPQSVATTEFAVLEEQLMTITAPQLKRSLISVDKITPWHKQAATLLKSCVPVHVTSVLVLNHVYSIGEQLLKAEVSLFQATQKKKSGRDMAWLRTVLSSGTFKDKMAAMTLLIQESPVHTLSTLDSLMAIVKKKCRRESLLAVDTLKQLWITDLLPEERKLKHLKQQPLQMLVDKKVNCYHQLLLWYYEDQLKVKYASFLSRVQELLRDPIADIREKMVGLVFDLLYQRPEQEQLLLNELVNKLGDPNRRIASKCILFLLKLLNHHVNMKLVVVREIESLLYRSNISSKAQYYAVCFLNQVVIGSSDQPLAMKLVTIYFSFFKIYTSKQEFDAKILGAVLTGINRAIPFLEDDIPSLDEQLNSLFKVVHVGPLATGVQSLMLLYQVMERRQAVSARYYRVLYQKLLDPQLAIHSAQQAMFLNVLFKSLKSDPELNRLKSFMKRILQVCCCHSPTFICGCLVLLSELLKVNPALWVFLQQSENENEEEHFTDVKEEEEEELEMKEEQSDRSTACQYRLDCREPLYSKAESTCLWELSKLMNHYHPTVQVFAKTLSKGEPVTYKGDPLQDFTTIRFLDQFVHKNPKKKLSDHGGSLMQPVNKLLGSNNSNLTSAAALLNMEKSCVREDMMFMYRFLKKDAELHRFKYSKQTKRSKRSNYSDEEEDEEEGRDEELMLGDSPQYKPEDIDFASEIEKQVKLKAQQKTRSRSMAQDEENQILSDGEFSYSDMDDEVDSDNEEEALTNDPSEAELEKLLLDNLSSDEEEDGHSDDTFSRRKKDKPGHSTQSSRLLSMYSSADEFAHLLNDTSSTHQLLVAAQPSTSEKQMKWEESRLSDYQGRKRKHTNHGARSTKKRRHNRPHYSS